MSIVAKSPSHRGEIAELFIHDAAKLLLGSLRSCNALYDLATTNALPRRLCFSINSQHWCFCHASAMLLSF